MSLAEGNLHGAELLQAQAHVWNHIFNLINSMSLKCAVELGIPDIIHNHGKPMTLSELVAVLPIHPTKTHFVYRLMRILVHSGFFAHQIGSGNTEGEGYVLTNASQLLVKDNPFSVTPLLLVSLDPTLIQPWHHVSAWFQNDVPSPFYAVHERTFWEYASREPKLNQFFNEAMASDGRLVSSVMTHECKGVFEGLNSLVDVGGGTGTVAKAIAKEFQHLDCTVFDLPHVVADLEGNARLNNLLNEAMASDGALACEVVMKKCNGVFEGLKSLVDVGGGTGAMAKCIAETFPTMNCTVFDLPHVVSGLPGSKNLKFVGGDIFESVPSADAILLKWILHDWISDEECVKILQQCKEVLGRNGKIGGKVIIMEMILGNQNWDENSIETQLFFDLFIMACVTGRERSEDEWAKLFFAAGFSSYKINPVLGVRGLIEVYP